MVGQRRLINKYSIMSKFEKELDSLLNTIERQDTKVRDLEKKLSNSEMNRIKLARAYAKKLGILVMKKSSKQIERDIFKQLKKEVEDGRNN